MLHKRASAHRGFSPVPAPVIGVLFLLSTTLAVISCEPMTAPGRPSNGTLTISLDEVVSASEHAHNGPEGASYVFSGDGPNGASFSLVSSDEVATVESLRAGTWLIRVEGLSEDGSAIIAGEATIEVESMAEVGIEIELVPIDGKGALFVTAEWDADLTVEPTARVTITGRNGESLTRTLYSSGSGTAEREISDLSTGYYELAVKLLDGGETVAGAAYTVRVVNESTIDVSSIFEMLNKVGTPITIEDGSFTIGWDPPSSGVPSFYRVYARPRGEYEWIELGTTAGDDPRFEVTGDSLPSGNYEFAVSSVEAELESDLHTSMSDDADPSSGWYVEWSGS